ncbi:MAG TPA: thiamine pyrophosphate-dependent dehydrogenase E1 component subunit alpha [Thiobacillaceae bacterium]|nr:thiamine pyrophosphate-dependent dehydrogenase E1 component subunit alpha [Thiobacillaceae bacterium]
MTRDFPYRELGTLSDPEQHLSALAISGRDTERLLRQLRDMLLIRRVEEKIGDMVTAGMIVCPCHLGIGQEAVAVGVSEHLRATDRVFGAHRSHSHYLALGGGVYPLLAEVLGKLDGCSKGMGGSMHLHDPAHGLLGTVPIVAGTVSLAVGAALAARKDGGDSLAVAYFGDGAAEEGVVHEAMNLAAAWRLPVLFVCENNLFSSHLHISLRQPSDRVARFAEAHRMSAMTIDGNDLLAVSDATASLVAGIRRGEGPAFLEALTYRWRGHVGPREDLDVGVNRGSDLALWKRRDPIRRLADALREAESLQEETWQAMDRAVLEEVETAWRRADAAPYPDESALLDWVYAGGAAK